MSQDINELAKIIYSALGSGLAVPVKYGVPKNKSEYPCVTYRFIDGEDNPYDEDLSVSNLIMNVAMVEVFSNSTSPIASNDIADSVYSLLHGKTFSNSFVKVHSCYRKSRESVYEDEYEVWHVAMRFDIVSSYQ